MDGEVNIGIASNQAEEWYPLFGAASCCPVPGSNWEPGGPRLPPAS